MGLTYDNRKKMGLCTYCGAILDRKGCQCIKCNDWSNRARKVKRREAASSQL